MKTTVDLPDDLIRRVKLRALDRNLKLREMIQELLEAGLDGPIRQKHTEKPPNPVQLKHQKKLTIDDIESAIAAGRN